MSLPRKKRSFRRIVVDGLNYDWRYFSQSGNLFIDIRLTAQPRQKLIIDLDGQDPWLRIPENIALHHLHACSAPITPKFIADAIKKSLKLGWQPQIHDRFNVKYEGGQYLLEQGDRRS